MTARVVVLGHAADRTGPPMYLLELLRRMDRSGLDLVVVLLRGGELVGALEEFAEVRVVGEPIDPQRATPERRAAEPARVAGRRARLADLVDADLVVVNTAWSIHALDWLPARSAPRLTVVHELSAGIEDLLPEVQLAELLASDAFVVGCGAVHDHLVDRLGVPARRVDLLPYGVDPRPDRDPSGARDVLAAGSDSYVVVAAAVPDRRKGPDLFVHLAAACRRLRPDVPWAFRWIGAEPGDSRLADALEDVGLLALDDVVRFLPPTPWLRDHLARAHAFVLTSRQDAFPLAAVEAAWAGLPVLAFATGGIGELVGDDAGGIVAFPDLEAAAALLASWYDHPAERRAAGAAAAARASAAHDARVHAAAFRTVVDRMLDRPAR